MMTIEQLAKIIKKGFDEVDARFDAVDKKFDAVDKKIDHKFFIFKKEMEEMMDNKLDRIWSELNSLRKQLERLEEKVDKLSERETEDIQPVYFDLEKLKKKVAFLEAEIKILKTDQQLKRT
ncbi:MAG TPA: hypothetical protein PLK76_01970 [bacterium]|nr:hypothetical protein [bacterium]